MSGDDVVLGKPFNSKHGGSTVVVVVDPEKLCHIPVARESSPSKVRVADVANLRPQIENHAMDMGI